METLGARLWVQVNHLQTNEPIEWDSPDLDAFDEWWFWQHLEWRIQQTTTSQQRKPYTEWLNAIYAHMKDKDMFVQTEYYKLKLCIMVK
jgi:hypothetical protein